jgi:hypothetical protein
MVWNLEGVIQYKEPYCSQEVTWKLKGNMEHSVICNVNSLVIKTE